MRQNKDGLIFGGVTAGAIFAAVAVYILSVHLSEQTGDSSDYETAGWLMMLGLLILSPFFGYAAVKLVFDPKASS